MLVSFLVPPIHQHKNYNDIQPSLCRIVHVVPLRVAASDFHFAGAVEIDK